MKKSKKLPFKAPKMTKAHMKEETKEMKGGKKMKGGKC